MQAKWYCRTCNEQIEKTDIETHEADGHDVKGVLRPERLLSNDPWTVGGGERPPNTGPTSVDTVPTGSGSDESRPSDDEEVTD